MRIDRLFEGDNAPTEPFQNLVSVKKELPLGERGMKQLIPWLGNNSEEDYLIVIADPRDESIELRTIMQRLDSGGKGSKIPLNKVVIVNSDTTSVNRR